MTFKAQVIILIYIDLIRIYFFIDFGARNGIERNCLHSSALISPKHIILGLLSPTKNVYESWLNIHQVAADDFRMAMLNWKLFLEIQSRDFGTRPTLYQPVLIQSYSLIPRIIWRLLSQYSIVNRQRYRDRLIIDCRIVL